eukprot:TRINITY_DN82268_c0_g1_i1.p1 TRINITY_DN82268_c0_g1~~TRINITY_DN82268_c0_g1_i1.p1  ORF type:complete len:329 (-),score=89.38 TRINITY_DN82268_c0_g1_i1:39-1025(-)
MASLKSGRESICKSIFPSFFFMSRRDRVAIALGQRLRSPQKVSFSAVYDFCLDLLKRHRKPFSKDEIKEYVSSRLNGKFEKWDLLWNTLKNKTKHFSVTKDERFSYTSALPQIQGPSDIVQWLTDGPRDYSSLLESDLTDTYPHVDEDVKALAKAGTILCVDGGSAKTHHLFGRSRSCHFPHSEEMCGLWNTTKVPDDRRQLVLKLERKTRTKELMPHIFTLSVDNKSSKKDGNATSEQKKPRQRERVNQHLPQMHKKDTSRVRIISREEQIVRLRTSSSVRKTGYTKTLRKRGRRKKMEIIVESSEKKKPKGGDDHAPPPKRRKKGD